MRRMLATCYLTLLRLTGIYGAFAVLAFFVAVPGMMARGQFAALPAVIAFSTFCRCCWAPGCCRCSSCCRRWAR